MEKKHCYATHRNDDGKCSTSRRIRLKPEAKLQSQRPSKVPIPYRDKLNTSLDDLQQKGLIKQIVSTPHEKPFNGRTFLTPLIFTKKQTILLKLCWMLDLSIQTLINLLNLGHWILWQHNLLGQAQIINLKLILCTHMHMLH